MPGARRAKTPMRPLRWLGLISAALMLYGGVRVAALVVDSNRKISALYASSVADRAQLVAVGQTPVGQPPQDIVGDQGPPGQPGAPGPAGAAGAPGRDGRDATPAQVAAAVAAYLRAHPPKPGPAGPAGRDGRDGQSPACMAEVDECRGATGAQGPAGQDGAAGQPPSAWLWTDPASKVSFECRRVESPDSAPAYACAAVT